MRVFSFNAGSAGSIVRPWIDDCCWNIFDLMLLACNYSVRGNCQFDLVKFCSGWRAHRGDTLTPIKICGDSPARLGTSKLGVSGPKTTVVSRGFPSSVWTFRGVLGRYLRNPSKRKFS